MILLDGGLSTVLEQQGADLGSALWTARLLAEEPERIASAHRAYFAAGAHVATTASYQASVPGYVAAGFSKPEALVGDSVRIARDVRDEFGGDRLVAASVGPYGAYLADGSEYRGNYGVDAVALRDFHAPRMELLAAAGPDLFAVETVPDVREAAVLARLLDEFGLPAWFSYSIRGDRTAAGQPLTEAYGVLAGCGVLVAAGVNCSEPSDVPAALAISVAVTGLPGIAYPNGGGLWDAEAKQWRQSDAWRAELADSWIEAGAEWIGGCCGVGPVEIAELAAHLEL
ncbi:MAG TPA: homocysteine S-methyltransferase [Propionicimonas sp.]|nr:homocysteine S-methyltransferase [Propionicimonas sp.]HRA06318.1 homocysteine S-methyltransferase [Propionicimonas sp.]